MQGVNIVPREYLHLTADQPIHMALYQEVIKRDSYLEFFKARAKEGKFIMLDNGAAEGCNPSPEQLLEAYDLLNPSEIVLPDVVGNSTETLKQSLHALRIFKEAGIIKNHRVMAVPQGATAAHWVGSMTNFVNTPEVQTIGISKFTTKLLADCYPRNTNIRMDLLYDTLRVIQNSQRHDIQIHLLGCYYSIDELREIQGRFPLGVRSTDSAIAYVYTRNNKSVLTNVERPDQKEINFHGGDFIDIELLKANLRDYRQVCS